MTNQLNKKLNSLKSGWYVWFFPVVALAICGWLLKEYYVQKGPTIKVYFEDGASIEAEKTQVRYRGVKIGVVKKVSITDDKKQIVADIALDQEAEDFAVEGSKFWIVMPKVSISGISGLETLIEGTYIAAQPGKNDDKLKYDFKGRLESETNDPLEDTVAYHLIASNVDSISPGDSVTFRGLKVGSVTKVNLEKTAQTVSVQINIQNKFVRLVRTNTAFWRKVAVKANLGLFSAEVKINSLESIIHGGVEMFTPDKPGDIAKAQTKFPLSDGAPKGSEKWNANLEVVNLNSGK